MRMLKRSLLGAGVVSVVLATGAAGAGGRSDSGTVYRIQYGKQANVEQLDNAGRPVCAWCFVPEGDLVAGDVMLAQKIALETNERAAIAIAIKYATLRTRRLTRAGPDLLAS